jgi:hypothetical protein
MGGKIVKRAESRKQRERKQETGNRKQERPEAAGGRRQ